MVILETKGYCCRKKKSFAPPKIARNFDIFCSFWMNNHFVKLQTQFSSIVDFEMLISFSFDHFWELFLLLIHRTQWFLNSKLSFGICIWDLSIIFLLFEDFSNFTALHCSHFGVLKLTDFHTESRLKLSRISCTRFSFCLAGWASQDTAQQSWESLLSVCGL